MHAFWLPNDPRGSWSDFVGAWELFRFGAATKTSTRRSVAARRHDAAVRLAAKSALKRQAVVLNGMQARAVAYGIADYAERSGLAILACAVLPDHVHVVLARHRLNVEQLVIQPKSAATRKLVEEELHPFISYRKADGSFPKCFARGEWKVFLNLPEDIRRAIRYVEGNPLKEGLPPQRWRFITPYV